MPISRRRFIACATLGVAAPSVGWTTLRGGTGDGADAPTPAAGPPLNAVAADRGDDLGTCRVVWSVPEAGPLVALTFDDGPHPELTPVVLGVLADAGVRATFNMMGHAVESHPDLARAVAAAGHEIGNHTATHLDLSRQDEPTTAAQLREATETITRVTGVAPRWFRPPKGHMTGSALREAARLGLDVALWSTRAGDLVATTPDQVVATTMKDLRPGAIVCLHDGLGRGLFNTEQPWAADLLELRRLELRALPGLLDAIEARGMRGVTLSELVAAGGPAR